MYTPKLPPELIRRLYRLKLVKEKPMTHLVREAVERYLSDEENATNQQNKKEEYHDEGGNTK